METHAKAAKVAKDAKEDMSLLIAPSFTHSFFASFGAPGKARLV
ncbi:MAG: hypothetical protein ABI882_22330 [Acidobacteriota bacterium]